MAREGTPMLTPCPAGGVALAYSGQRAPLAGDV
jgi:hypothetical protein